MQDRGGACGEGGEGRPQSAVGVASLRHGEGGDDHGAQPRRRAWRASFRKRVVLVEANLRSALSCALIYRLPAGPGLSDVLAGDVRIFRNALEARRLGQGALLVLPASTAPPGNPAAIPGRALRDLMAELFGYADLLVFDLAPILPYPDTVQLSASLDGLALVLRAGRSRRSDSRRAMTLLQGEGAPVLGAVLNRERSFIPGFVERWL